MLLLIDNFDSFSHILADLIRQTGEELLIFRNDVTLAELDHLDFDGLILSPGPGRPRQAGNLMEILQCYVGQIPILGVCLGHQAIGEFFGAQLVKNENPTHGKVYQVKKSIPHLLTESLPNRFAVTRYHSLILKDLPEKLEKILETDSGEIMAITHVDLPILGIQYHPEAHLTDYGLEIVKTWTSLCLEHRRFKLTDYK
jgi:anthranilate synthase component 2